MGRCVCPCGRLWANLAPAGTCRLRLVTLANNVNPGERATSSITCAQLPMRTLPRVSLFKAPRARMFPHSPMGRGAGSWTRSKGTMGPREALDCISTMVKAGLACDDIGEVHALLRDMQLTAQRAISQRGLRSRRVLSLTNRSLNHGSGSG